MKKNSKIYSGGCCDQDIGGVAQVEALLRFDLHADRKRERGIKGERQREGAEIEELPPRSGTVVEQIGTNDRRKAVKARFMRDSQVPEAFGS